MTSATTLLAEADLHGLVDGYIAPERRSEALRRLAVSPGDRARVESWQAQNDLLRSAFLGIVREPLPAMLDLKVKPQLHCVAANDAPIVALPLNRAAPVRRRTLATALAALVVVAAGLGGSWFLLNDAQTEVAVPGAELRGPVDVALATLSSDAIKRPAANAVVTRRAAERLPTTEIPDLRAAGFSFAGADASATDPVSIVFRYQNRDAERVAVTVAARSAAEKVADTQPTPIGSALGWHKGDRVYAIAGTVRPAKLRALAMTLQKDDSQ